MGIAEKLADEKKPANSDYLSNALASQDIDLEVKGLGLWERHAELLQSAERIGIAPWYYWKIERLSLLESKNDVFSDGHNPCDAIREGLSYTLKGDAENAAALFKKAIDSGKMNGIEGIPKVIGYEIVNKTFNYDPDTNYILLNKIATDILLRMAESGSSAEELFQLGCRMIDNLSVRETDNHKYLVLLQKEGVLPSMADEDGLFQLGDIFVYTSSEKETSYPQYLVSLPKWLEDVIENGVQAEEKPEYFHWAAECFLSNAVGLRGKFRPVKEKAELLVKAGYYAKKVYMCIPNQSSKKLLEEIAINLGSLIEEVKSDNPIAQQPKPNTKESSKMYNGNGPNDELEGYSMILESMREVSKAVFPDSVLLNNIELLEALKMRDYETAAEIYIDCSNDTSDLYQRIRLRGEAVSMLDQAVKEKKRISMVAGSLDKARSYLEKDVNERRSRLEKKKSDEEKSKKTAEEPAKESEAEAMKRAEERLDEFFRGADDSCSPEKQKQKKEFEAAAEQRLDDFFKIADDSQSPEKQAERKRYAAEQSLDDFFSASEGSKSGKNKEPENPKDSRSPYYNDLTAVGKLVEDTKLESESGGIPGQYTAVSEAIDQFNNGEGIAAAEQFRIIAESVQSPFVYAMQGVSLLFGATSAMPLAEREKMIDISLACFENAEKAKKPGQDYSIIEIWKQKAISRKTGIIRESIGGSYANQEANLEDACHSNSEKVKKGEEIPLFPKLSAEYNSRISKILINAETDISATYDFHLSGRIKDEAINQMQRGEYREAAQAFIEIGNQFTGYLNLMVQIALLLGGESIEGAKERVQHYQDIADEIKKIGLRDGSTEYWVNEALDKMLESSAKLAEEDGNVPKQENNEKATSKKKKSKRKKKSKQKKPEANESGNDEYGQKLDDFFGGQ